MPFGRAWFAKPQEGKEVAGGAPSKEGQFSGVLVDGGERAFDAYGRIAKTHPIFAKALEEGVDLFAKAPTRVFPTPEKLNRIVETPKWSTSVNPRFNREKEMEHITLCFSTIDRISAFAKHEGRRAALHFNDDNALEDRLRWRKVERNLAKACLRSDSEEVGGTFRSHFIRRIGVASAFAGRSRKNADLPVVPLREASSCSFWRTSKRAKEGSPGLVGVGGRSPETPFGGTKEVQARPWSEGSPRATRKKPFPFAGRPASQQQPMGGRLKGAFADSFG